MPAVFELFGFVSVLLGFCTLGSPGAVTMTVLACVTITDAGGLLVLSGVGEAPAWVVGEVVVNCFKPVPGPESKPWLEVAGVIDFNAGAFEIELSTPVKKTVQLFDPPP